jgi:IS5 family transposase
VQRARERPGQVELVEGVLVDGDDDDGSGGRTHAAQLEEAVEGAQLEHLQGARQRERHRHHGRRDSAEERPGAGGHALNVC